MTISWVLWNSEYGYTWSWITERDAMVFLAAIPEEDSGRSLFA